MHNERNQQRAPAITVDADLTQAFRERLPFALTHAQEKVISENKIAGKNNNDNE